MTCRCHGRFKGCAHDLPCPNPPGGRWSPYFCEDCDVNRVAHINRRVEEHYREIRESRNVSAETVRKVVEGP